MCILFLALGMLIFGIITLITGKFQITRNKSAYGAPARIVGVIMLLPLPLFFLTSFLLGVGIAATGGQVNQEDMPRLERMLSIVAISLIMGCFGVGLAIALNYGVPTRIQRRARDDDDDDFDDRPRRRRRDEEDEDDDRPRRRPRADDGYDDDEPRPRRRPPDDDDDRPRRRDPDDRIR